jgi:hypothetical protein
VRVDEHRRTGTVDEIDPTTAQSVGQPPLIMHVVGDAAGAGECRGDVDVRTGPAQAEVLP